MLLMPWLLSAYAVAFLSGAVYYLEQRVARIRDQFPRRTPLARLYGVSALAIGTLGAASVVGHLVLSNNSARLAALVAVGAGVAFWLHRLRTGLGIGERIRAAALALVCAVLVLIAVHWVRG